MKESNELKKTFNLIFASIIALVFVTISGFVSEFNNLNKEQKTLSIQSIIERIKASESDINEEFYISLIPALSLRFREMLKESNFSEYELALHKKNECLIIPQKHICTSEYNSFKKMKSKNISFFETDNYTTIVVPLKMFKKSQGKIILKIYHSHTVLNQINFFLINTAPLIILIILWFFLYRFVEKNIIVPQINKIAEYETQKVLFNSIQQVSHDLRTPIEVVKETLKSPGIPQEEMDILKNATKRIDNIVSEVLKKTQKEISNQIIFNINDVAKKIIKEQEIINPHIEYSLISKTSESYYFEKLDSVQFTRSLSNIITNASESILNNGRIELLIEPNNHSFKLAIKDSGTGIKESYKDNIFKKGHTSKYSGHGLGLYSTRVWLSSIGGSINFESTYGVGSTFSIQMPQLTRI